MTEDSIFAADGSRVQTGKTSPQAQKWADMMTEKYAELCVAEPIFDPFGTRISWADRKFIILTTEPPTPAKRTSPSP